MKKLSEWLIRISGKWVVASFLLVLILFVFLVLPGNTHIKTADRQAPRIPDLSFWYTAEHLYKTAEIYGENGRMEYIKMHAGFDLVWPAVYVGFLAVSISWVFAGISGESLYRRLNLIPVAAGIFDFLENLFTSIVMLRYPELSLGIDSLAPIATLLKWLLVYLSVLVLLAGISVSILRVLRNTRKYPEI